MSLGQVLDDLSKYVELQMDEGTSSAKVSEDVMGGLKGAVEGQGSQEPVTEAAPKTSDSPGSGADLERIALEISECKLCQLHSSRTKTVPGQGSPSPEIMFVGEGPGADEDKAGLAFVGRAGQLLTRMIEAMGYTREEVFIGNIVKCRPPENRAPEPAEMIACMPYLKRQIAALQPRVIVALGATAVKGLVEMPKGMGITKLRGTWMSFEGIDLMPTFHPAYLLRNANMKKYVWEDLKTVLHHLGRPIPEVKKRG
ncbi:MAG: uracil-DNA glycosylase [Kiritimatiellia bacterium]|jgi:DNA polymerase|nr:uracil-DNA glycosylase [Kiritimatiellia bacterium]